MLVEVADFQITYGNGSDGASKKGFPHLVFRNNMTKIWVGGSTKPPKDRPECGFNNELCPPPTEKPQGLDCNKYVHVVQLVPSASYFSL